MFFVCPSKTEASTTLCFVTSDFSHFHSKSPKALGCGAMLACAGRVVAFEVQPALLCGMTHMYSFNVSLEQMRWVLGLFSAVKKSHDFQTSSNMKSQSVRLYCLF